MAVECSNTAGIVAGAGASGGGGRLGHFCHVLVVDCGGYALCAAWFTYADRSGLTTRKAMERMELQRKQRIEKQREILGTRRKR